MISKILIASDGSKTSQKAAAYAIDLAKQIQATIIALGVIDKRMFMGQNLPEGQAGVRDEGDTADYLRGIAEKNLAEVSNLCQKSGVNIKTAIRIGYPVEEIVKEAKKANADVIIMGSRGMSALSATALGSVSYGVIYSDSTVPVLIVR